MNRPLPRPAFVGLALLAALLGSREVRAAESMAMDHGAAMPAQPVSGIRTAAGKALAASNEAMMKGMEAKLSGNTDRDFVAMMLPHHQGAVDMAKVELRYGRDPMLRKLAATIIAAQAKEIAEMRAWRRRHAP